MLILYKNLGENKMQELLNYIKFLLSCNIMTKCGRTDGRTDGWMDGWMDGWIEKPYKENVKQSSKNFLTLIFDEQNFRQSGKLRLSRSIVTN